VSVLAKKEGNNMSEQTPVEKLQVKPKALKRLLIIAGLCVWGYFIWPTPWKEYKAGSINFRVNRFTGTTYQLSARGWVNSSSPEPAKKPFYVPESYRILKEHTN
jgi:hypothetical protein